MFCLSPGDKVRIRWNMTMISNTDALFIEQGERMCGVKTHTQKNLTPLQSTCNNAHTVRREAELNFAER